jgi:hypothetical protein
MTITAKYASTCRICRGAIEPGDAIDWERGQRPAHAACAGNPRDFLNRRPAAPAPRPSVPAPTGPRRNQRPGSCAYCGTPIEAGAGELFDCLGSSGGCRQHWAQDGGWHVRCLDREACRARDAARRAEAAAAQAAEEQRQVARAALNQAEREPVDTIPAEATAIGGYRTGAGHKLWYVAPDGAAYLEESSWDDDAVPQWRVAVTAEQIRAAYPDGVELAAR